MKKILTILLTVLFSVQFATAQQTLYVISKTGELAAYSASKVAFNDLFTFAYSDVTEVTKAMFSASFNVALNSDEYKSLKYALEVGICFSDVNESPTINDGKIKKGRSLGIYTFSINGLDAGTTYYYRAYAKVNDAVFYGEVQSQTTVGKSEYKIINGHKFVDLGLPSGLLWATCNVGAVTAADDGNYYAWGETELKPYCYTWSSYKYGSSSSNLSKYNSSYSKTVLDKDDDAAYVNWGSSCRMPKQVEFSELLNSDNCTWTWTSQTTSSGSSVEGYKVTSNTNGNSIFLPASGYRADCDWGSGGLYWSSTLVFGDASRAYHLDFGSSSHDCGGSYRYRGHTVRPVAEP